MILRIGFFIFCLCLAIPAHAEGYIPVTWTDLLHTMIKFNALDVTADNGLLDEYAAITDCDLYEYFYKDDFKWNQVRNTMRKSIIENMPTYPSHYRFDTKLKLDRYDFDAGLYRFADGNPLRQINSITVFEFSGPVCGELQVAYFPLLYRAKLDPPISVPGLALDAKSAEALLDYMNASGDNDHYVWARFNMTVVYIEPFRKIGPAPGSKSNEVEYLQSHNDRRAIVIDVHMDSIQFYEDAEMTKPIYTFKPPS